MWYKFAQDQSNLTEEELKSEFASYVELEIYRLPEVDQQLLFNEYGLDDDIPLDMFGDGVFFSPESGSYDDITSAIVNDNELSPFYNSETHEFNVHGYLSSVIENIRHPRRP